MSGVTFYQRFLRPLLFRLPPETAHVWAGAALRTGLPQRLIRPLGTHAAPQLETEMAGLRLGNPIGLAAGYDKDCQLLAPLLGLGFGYVTGGTVTRDPRQGNPRPRIVRLPQEEALVNALGFPGKGASYAEARLRRLAHRPAPVVVSIAGLTLEEYLECHRRLEPLADGIELNVSSPNTQGVRLFQDPGQFNELVESINAQRRKPLLVKLPPYFDDAGRQSVLALVRRCLLLGVSGVTAVNTRPVAEPRLRVGQGGLSGRPLFPHMLRVVREIHAEAGGRLAINACGGIATGGEVLQALEAGATTVQLFTALVYRGPGVVAGLNRELAAALRQRGLTSVTQAKGVS